MEKNQTDEGLKTQPQEEPEAPQESAHDGPESAENPVWKARELDSLVKEYPQAVQNGALTLPKEVIDLKNGGMGLLDAYRLYDLRKTRRTLAELRARYDAEKANRANAAASTGSVCGGDACEKSFYTSQEWDRLPGKLKKKFIKNGKIFEFMKKWSEKK